MIKTRNFTYLYVSTRSSSESIFSFKTFAGILMTMYFHSSYSQLNFIMWLQKTCNLIWENKSWGKLKFKSTTVNVNSNDNSSLLEKLVITFGVTRHGLFINLKAIGAPSIPLLFSNVSLQMSLARWISRKWKETVGFTLLLRVIVWMIWWPSSFT